jgi:hypothetical protein
MLQIYCDSLFTELNAKREEILKKRNIPINRLSAMLNLVRDYLDMLRVFISEHPFEDKKQEIWFFKYGKPRFYALYIFHVELFNLSGHIPGGTDSQVREYFEAELKNLQRFFRLNQFHYQYFKTGANELDNIYFIRGEKLQHTLIPEIPELDPEFSTSCDYLFSKFIAYEMLRDHILEAIAKLTFQKDPTLVRLKKPMKWTGQIVSLVELAYGIHDTGQINDGDITISDIITWLGQSLQVNLSTYYRRFNEIKMRKTISKTHFIERMRESVKRRIDDANGIKPKTTRRARRNNIP